MQEERKESATGGANGSASDSLTVSLQEEVAALKLQLALRESAASGANGFAESISKSFRTCKCLFKRRRRDSNCSSR